MKLAKNMVAATIAWIVIGSVAASAQVLKQVPSNALAVLKVSALDATSKKVADLATSLGIVQMQPEMADPLGAALKEIGVTDGVNRSGDMAFAYIDPAAFNTPDDKSILLLLPVSDYQKFVGNFADATPDGDLTQVHFKNDTDITYLAHWGDYVAASPSKEIVAKPPTDIIQVEGLAAKELDGKDFIVFGNLKALRPKMLQGIDKLRQQTPGEIDNAVTSGMKLKNLDAAKFAPLAKVAATQFLNLAQEFTEGAEAASFSINLSPDGIASTLMCQFEAGSACGNHVAEVKNTDESLLGGLGDGKYLVFGGSSPEHVAKTLADFLAPIQSSINDLGPTYASLNDWLNAVQKLVAVSEGQSFGLMAPTAQPGQGALLEGVGVRHGDAKVMLAVTHQMADAQQAAMKALGVDLPGGTQTYIPAAKTVDGVSFDEMKSNFNMNNNNSPQAMQIAQLMMMIYGPQGPSAFMGVVDDHTFLTVMGLDDASISAAIAAAKSGDDPLAKSSTVKSVAAQLPAQRFAVFYVPLDLWATTGFGYAKMFGIDMGVTMPDNLPPMGTTFSTDGTAVRMDTYVPSQLMQALATASMQVYMKTQNPGPPPQNGGGGNGGGGAAPGGL